VDQAQGERLTTSNSHMYFIKSATCFSFSEALAASLAATLDLVLSV